MNARRTIFTTLGLMLAVAAYWLVGSGALGTGDLQPAAPIPGPTGGVRSSPSTGAAGSPPIDAAARLVSGQTASSAGGELAGGGPSSPALLFISPASVVAENVVTASGQGFAAAETIDLSMRERNGGAGIALGRARADKEGRFSGQAITLTHKTPAGDHTIVALGRQSGLQAQALIKVFAPRPYANPTTYSGKGGSGVQFEAGGFTPHEAVALFFDSLAVDPLAQAVAGASGAISVSVAVPFAQPGEHAFLLIGSTSATPVRVPFSVVPFGPWFAPTNYSPTPELALGFTGHDFAPGEEVRIYRNQAIGQPVAIAHAGERGEFTLDHAWEIPVDAVGEGQFVAEGIYSRAAVTTTVTVLPFQPILELTIYAGQPGATVAFKGSGYARGETMRAYLGGVDEGPAVAEFQADGDGALEGAGSFVIPAETRAGKVTISVAGDRSKVARGIDFEVLPLSVWGVLTSYAGPPGTLLGFEGHGFQKGEPVSIHLGNRQSLPLSTVTADDNGEFAGGTFLVPDSAINGERFTFFLVGERSDAEANVSFDVTVGEDPTEAIARPAADGAPTSETR